MQASASTSVAHSLLAEALVHVLAAVSVSAANTSTAESSSGAALPAAPATGVVGLLDAGLEDGQLLEQALASDNPDNVLRVLEHFVAHKHEESLEKLLPMPKRKRVMHESEDLLGASGADSDIVLEPSAPEATIEIADTVAAVAGDEAEASAFMPADLDRDEPADVGAANAPLELAQPWNQSWVLTALCCQYSTLLML